MASVDTNTLSMC